VVSTILPSAFKLRIPGHVNNRSGVM
jgi:hypothetical protein